MYNKAVNPYEKYFVERKANNEVVQQALYDGFRLDLPEGTPKEMCDLTDRCLKRDGKDRPTMSEVVAAIERFYASFNLP